MKPERWLHRRKSRARGRRDKHLVWGLLMIVTAAFALGCSEAEEKRDAGAPAFDEERLNEERARQLHGLGYIDFAVETGDTSGESGVLSRSPTRSWPGYDLITYPVLARAELIRRLPLRPPSLDHPAQHLEPIQLLRAHRQGSRTVHVGLPARHGARNPTFLLCREPDISTLG